MLRTIMATLPFFLVGCGERSGPENPGSDPASAGGPVLATTWPLAGLAQAVLGPEHTVECLVPEGEDPGAWQPSGEELSRVVASRWIVMNGAGFEPWAKTANLPTSRVHWAGKDFEGRWRKWESAKRHSHGPQGAHTHAGHDPHFWMDPLLALEMGKGLGASAVERGLIGPEQKDAHLVTLENELRELDALWAQIAEALNGQVLLANHGTYHYPAERHGIELRVIDADPEGSFAQKAVESLSIARAEGKAKFFLWEAQPSAKLKKELADIYEFQSVILRPAESPNPEGLGPIAIWRADLSALLMAVTP